MNKVKRLRTRDLSLALALFLSACTNSSPDGSVVEPDVAISQVNGPLSVLLTETGGETVYGPLVDSIDARRPRTGPLLVAADQQFDPVSRQTTANPISVYVTASDERGVASVELALDGQSMGDYVAGVDTQVFKNPFIFPSRRSGLSSVPIPGASSGLVASVLRAETENIDGTRGETAVLELQADGSRPLLTFNVRSSDSPITTESLVTLTGSTSDSETGVIAFAAFLNGEAIEINPETPFSFDEVVDGLTAGTQTVRLVATNGVLVPNEAVFTFNVTEVPEETDPSDPTTTTDPTDPTTTTDPTDPTEAPIIESFTASAGTSEPVAPNTNITLTWSVTGDVTKITIAPEGGDAVDVTEDADKQLIVSPAVTTTYTLTASNASGETTQNVTVNVQDDNGGVDAVDDTASTTAGEAVTIPVLSNDKPSVAALTIIAATSPTEGGSVEISRDQKTVIYTPKAGFTGTDTFSYTVGDGKGNRATASVSVEVN